ncbi:heterokaryon incompatibility protein-domain-containing protein [Cladorrhinum sp. PSN259]|nr:heterokaryon incompatibility protein-domain-containing protein [Cladorrhinum sp. PSN259]
MSEALTERSEPLYEYNPLPENHIRLLNLHPSTDNDPNSPLSGDLLTIPLFSDFPSPFPFSAISYVWGNSLPSNSSEQTLSTPTGIIRLTPSLFSFLVRLRHSSTQPLLLWADAICINQIDPHEKQHQVGLMADVYRSAAQVLADLGEETEDTGIALETIDSYWRAGVKRGVDGRAFGRSLTTEETCMFLDLPLPLRDDGKGDGEEKEDETFKEPEPHVSGAVVRFFERPWFRRIWVVQEFVLAKEVQLFCGTKKVAWQQLLAAGIIFDGMPMIFQNSITHTLREIQGCMSYMCMAYIRRIRALNATEEGRKFVEYLGSLSNDRLMRFYNNPGLVELLHYLRASKATLGRDRYFALLGLASDMQKDDWGELRPDYISTDDVIVRRFARVLIRKVEKQSAAEMIMRAGLWRGTNPELPSWFEDSTQDRHGETIMDLTVEEAAHKAAGDTEFVVSSDPQFLDAILLKGYRIDALTQVCPPYGPHGPTEMVVDDVQEVVFDYIRKGAETLLKFSTSEDDPVRTGPYLTGEDIVDAAALTLCVYRGIERLAEARETLFRGFWFMCWAVIGSGTSWNNYHGIFRYTWSSEMKEHIGSDIEYYATELGSVLHIGLLPAVSSKGYFVSAPAGASIDDEIWIVQGCRIPLLLRKNNEPAYGGQYRLVGSCYVHGVMNGEALQYPDFEWKDISLC